MRTRAGLRHRPRDEYILSSKPGSNTSLAPWVAPAPFDHYHDYTCDGVMRSSEQGQLRLGIARYDCSVVFDLDFWTHKTDAQVQHHPDQFEHCGWRALEELRDQGLLKSIGAGINELGMRCRFLEFCEPDFWLVAMPYMLLRQEMLDQEFKVCEERSISAFGCPIPADLWAELKHRGLLREDAPAPS